MQPHPGLDEFIVTLATAIFNVVEFTLTSSGAREHKAEPSQLLPQATHPPDSRQTGGGEST